MSDTKNEMVDEIGRGPLSRGAAIVYRMLVLEAQLLIATLPTTVAIMLLDRDPSNLPLFLLALTPIAPALVAGVSAVRAASATPDLAPGRHFSRAYRRDFGPTLRWAAPAALALAVLSFNLTHLGAVEGGTALRPLILLLAAAIVVWCGHMIVLTASFRFRTRDAARIALAQLLPRWPFSLGILSLLVVGAFLVHAASEILLLLLLWAFAALLALMARPVIDDVTARFTRDAASRS
ncbi:glycosyl transferase [Microbacterium hydrocarbonoxydans]|uniref:glycosyl transferase n=1 Tax=Microbacterium hydrocarbonoxydans TaxID=273678 RepID=UPI0013DD1CAE|nr:glycosyl transferase [Microbacterium hydrocarbonoxydans]